MRRFDPLRWLRSRGAGSTRLGTATERLQTLAQRVGRGHALRLAHRELHALFGRQAGLRQLLPHLSWLEKSLRRQGSRGLRRLPSPLLQCALAQLESLPPEDSPADLATLRTRIVETMALRIAVRDHAIDPPGGSAPGRARPGRPTRLRETSLSVFDEGEGLPGRSRALRER